MDISPAWRLVLAIFGSDCQLKFHVIPIREIEETLNSLCNDRERTVLRRRFGLDDGRLWKLREVGQEFKVSRERIRQIEAKALRKLRHPTRSRRLRAYITKREV